MQQLPAMELLVLQMLYGVGSCVQMDAATPNNVRTCSLLWEGYDLVDVVNLQNLRAILFSTC